MHARPPRHLDGVPDPGRCLVMGVLNVTPNSFSDGGEYLAVEKAIAHGLDLVAQGADLVDVGGESTRPGAERPGVEEELARVLPVVTALAARGVVVSVDTMRAETAAAAVARGARLVNDVSGGLADEEMLPEVARLGVPYVAMHWRAHSIEMDHHTSYDDVVHDVLRELRVRLEAAVAAGVDPSRVALDPGIGFAKTIDQNWELLAALSRLDELGQPVMVGASRKRFLGHLLADAEGQPRPPREREDATTATTALAVAAGAWCVRSHAARASRDAVAVATRWAESTRTGR